ncbi:MAG: radical SAM protein [Bacteroidales bacterium]|nr:radical SAM protein [Bacteroidales bacterium]
MVTKHYNIPIFLPEMACPFRCVYCNQQAITGVSKLPDERSIINEIEMHLSTIDYLNSYVEIAFFGGNFTGIPEPVQKQFLSIAETYIIAGKIKGIRISTRPDFINDKNLSFIRQHGVKVIELGVQSMDDGVLRQSERAYNSETVIRAAKQIKEHGFLLGMQMMTGLPGDSPEKSIKTAKSIIELGAQETRIYPLLVIKNTKLEKLYNEGLYKSQTLEEAVILAKNLFNLFNKSGVRVLKMGLHPSKELTQHDAVIDGPFHSSFAELVYTEIWKEKFSDIFPQKDKVLQIILNKNDYNHAIGYKGINKKQLKSLFKNVLFDTNDSISKHEFQWHLI